MKTSEEILERLREDIANAFGDFVFERGYTEAIIKDYANNLIKFIEGGDDE